MARCQLSSVDREGKYMVIGIVRRWGCAAVLLMLGMLCHSSARGELVYFQVAELPGHETHHDSFILPLSDSADIAHAPAHFGQTQKCGMPAQLFDRAREGTCRIVRV